MSEQVNLNAEAREIDGKSSSRKLRNAGSVPAVIYGGETDPMKVSILEKDIIRLRKFLVHNSDFKDHRFWRRTKCYRKRITKTSSNSKSHVDFQRVKP